MASGPLPRLRRHGPQRLCANCQQPVSESLAFCPSCLVSIKDYPPVMNIEAEPTRYFKLPDYLHKASLPKYQQSESTGSGFVILGLCLLLIPAATGNLSPPAVLSLITGFLLTIAGIARARVDQTSLVRNGLTTVAVAALVLGFIGYRLTEQPPSKQRAALIDATETPAPTETASDVALSNGSAESVSMPMARGSIGHLGTMPGSALVGNPYRLWRYDSGKDLKSAPVISDGAAYIGTHDGFLMSIDLADGTPNWRFDLGGYPVSGSPAVVNRTVYVGSGYFLFAIDQERGTERWRFAMDYAGESSPVVDGETVFIASKENYVYAINTETGEKEWSFKSEGLIFGSPAVSDDFVIVADDIGNVYGIGKDSGHTRWRFPAVLSKMDAPGAVFSTTVVDENRVFVTFKSLTTYVLDLQTGEPVWSYPVGGTASPAVDGGTLYVGSDDGAIYAFDFANQDEPLWLFSTGDGEVTSPVIVDEALYVAAGPTLIALDRRSGEQLWRYPVGDAITSDIVVADGTIYFGTRDGNLYAVTGDGTSDERSNSV